MSLLQFVENYPVATDKGTDKYGLGYIHEFYDKLFTPKKDSTQNLLEIGVQEGKSILLWKDYFENATIYGVDVDECPSLHNLQRVNHIVCDAYSDHSIDLIKNDHFDIIIDDGPHTYDSMVVFLTKYFSKLKSGGIMVLEDIIDVNWTPKLLELVDQSLCRATVINMAGKQIDLQLKQRWIGGLDIIVLEKF